MSEGLNYENDVLTVQKYSDKDRDIIAIKKDGDYAVKSEIVQSDGKQRLSKSVSLYNKTDTDTLK